jgi:hypothetical protein
MDHKVLRVSRVPLDLLVVRERMVYKVDRVLKGQVEQKAQPAPLERKAYKVRMAQLVVLEHKVLLVPKALKANRAQQDLMAHRELLEHKV